MLAGSDDVLEMRVAAVKKMEEREQPAGAAVVPGSQRRHLRARPAAHPPSSSTRDAARSSARAAATPSRSPARRGASRTRPPARRRGACRSRMLRRRSRAASPWHRGRDGRRGPCSGRPRARARRRSRSATSSASSRRRASEPARLASPLRDERAHEARQAGVVAQQVVQPSVDEVAGERRLSARLVRRGDQARERAVRRLALDPPLAREHGRTRMAEVAQQAPLERGPGVGARAARAAAARRNRALSTTTTGSHTASNGRGSDERAAGWAPTIPAARARRSSAGSEAGDQRAEPQAAARGRAAAARRAVAGRPRRAGASRRAGSACAYRPDPAAPTARRPASSRSRPGPCPAPRAAPTTRRPRRGDLRDPGLLAHPAPWGAQPCTRPK